MVIIMVTLGRHHICDSRFDINSQGILALATLPIAIAMLLCMVISRVSSLSLSALGGYIIAS
jgi:hypothetical protein